MSSTKSWKFNRLAMLAMAMAGIAGDPLYADFQDKPKLPKRTCKDCSYYTGGTYCKRAKHNVTKHTPSNGCAHFKM